MIELQAIVERVAPCEAPVLITGESGTGKEVMADLIHKKSKKPGPFVKINCAALPRELIESELFGHTKGSFTGAYAPKEGLFRRAENGSIFLDELGDMPVDTQTKLLRVLQEKQARQVGGTVDYEINCRVIAATNRNPQHAIMEGRLREDLYYRLSVLELHLPPLRERREEILPLARRFLRITCLVNRLTVSGFADEVEEVLRGHEWPGNVRQLQNVVQRAALMATGSRIESIDIAFLTVVNHPTLPEALQERKAIERALAATRGNKAKAAELLGIARSTLYEKLEAFNLTYANS